MDLSINNVTSIDPSANNSFHASSATQSSWDSLNLSQFALTDDFPRDVVDVQSPNNQLDDVVDRVMKDLGSQLSPVQQKELRENLLTAGRAAFPV